MFIRSFIRTLNQLPLPQNLSEFRNEFRKKVKQPFIRTLNRLPLQPTEAVIPVRGNSAALVDDLGDSRNRHMEVHG
jgi:hypothetical protein